MRCRVFALASGLVFLLALVIWSRLPASGCTRLQLTDVGTGRKILSTVLRDGDSVVLTWTNSLFGQLVTETFIAHNGCLVQDSVTFLDPQHPQLVPVTVRDVDDLYHTGGSFSASGLARPFTRIVYRVGEIGNPVMVVQGQAVAFKDRVGFGGRIVLTTSPAMVYEKMWSCW